MAKILLNEKATTMSQRRMSIEKYYDEKRRGEKTVTISGTAIFAAAGWVTSKLGLTENATKLNVSTKTVPLPMQIPPNDIRIGPVPSPKQELVVMKIELDCYPPFQKVSDAIWNLQNVARDREYVEGRGYGYPKYLTPNSVEMELGFEAFYPPVAIVPEYDAKEFLTEVSQHAAILKVTSGMLLLLEQWTKEILKYPITSGPEGGGSIRL